MLRVVVSWLAARSRLLPWTMEPCLFRSLDYAIASHPGKTQALRFSLCDEQEKLDALQKAIEPLNLYELLWALVLRLYTGNETVAFGAQINIQHGDSWTESVDICSAVMFKTQIASSIEIRRTHVPFVVDNAPWEGTLPLNTKVLYAQPKLLGVSVDTKSRQQEILHEDRQMRLLTVVDFDPFAHMPRGHHNGLVAVFEDWMGELMLEIHFKSSDFSNEAVFNVGNTCCRVFQSLLLNPSQVISEIQSLSDHDLEQILAWNSGDRLSVESTIHKEIGRHIQNCPDAPAIHAWDGNLTYYQLDLNH